MTINRGKGRRIGTILKITGALIVALVVGAVAVLYSLDANEYRSFVAERVEAATGRALEIEGDVDLKLSLHPRLGVAGVSFANAPWGSHSVMMRLERLEAEVSLVPLLFGDVHVERLVLVGADILLETDKEGRANWQIAAPAEPPPPSADGAPRIPSFSEILIENLRVRFRDGATGRILSLGLDRLAAEAESLSSPVEIEAEGTYGFRPFQAEARPGLLQRLLGKGTGSYPVRLALFADGAEARIEGALADPLKARGVALKVTAEGNELAELAAWAEVQLPTLGAFNLAGPPTESGDGRVFPDDPPALDALQTVGAVLSLAMKTAVLGEVTVVGTSIEANLENGCLTVKPLKLWVGGATVSGQALIDGCGKSPRVEARIGAQSLEVAELLAGTAVADLIDGKLDVDTAVKDRGRSVRALMAGLDGFGKTLDKEFGQEKP